MYGKRLKPIDLTIDDMKRHITSIVNSLYKDTAIINFYDTHCEVINVKRNKKMFSGDYDIVFDKLRDIEFTKRNKIRYERKKMRIKV